MNKKYVMAIIGVLIVVFASWFFRQGKSFDYDDYEAMQTLSAKSDTELRQEGYSVSSVNKIKAFNPNYYNHLALLDLEGDLKNYGYHNRRISDESGHSIIYGEDRFPIKNKDLTFVTTITDVAGIEEMGRHVGRIVVEFEWNGKPSTKKQLVHVDYRYFIAENVYSLLTYENLRDENDVIHRIAEIEPRQFLDEFYTAIDPMKKIEGQEFVLSSGTIILDVASTFAESEVAPLSVTSQYTTKSFWGKENVLAEQEMVGEAKGSE